MTLPKETIDAIKNEASRLATGMWPDNSPYSIKRRASAAALIELGATEWAGRAQELVDALEFCAKPIEHNDANIALYTRQEIAKRALAKYKEVTNG